MTKHRKYTIGGYDTLNYGSNELNSMRKKVINNECIAIAKEAGAHF